MLYIENEYAPSKRSAFSTFTKRLILRSPRCLVIDTIIFSENARKHVGDNCTEILTYSSPVKAVGFIVADRSALGIVFIVQGCDALSLNF